MKLRASNFRFLPFPACMLAGSLAAMLATPSAQAQSWSGATNGDWLTTTNWTGSVAAGEPAVTTDTDIAVFNVALQPTIGINMTTTSGVYYLGAIDNTNATVRIFNNNSTTTPGVLTLNGAAVNSVANTIFRNSTTTLMTLTNGTGSGTLGLELGNVTNNIIQLTGTGGITINSIISGSSKNLTFSPSGSGTGVLTLAGANTYTGTTNILAGSVTVGNASALSTTSGVSLASAARLTVNAANTNLSKLSTANGGSGVVAGSFLRYSQAQTAAGASNGPGTIFGTVELNNAAVNPVYPLDFGSGGALANVLAGAVTYTSPLTLSGTASIDASQAVVTNTATYSTGGITASNAGTKTLNLTGSNTGANTISSTIGNGSGTIALTKGGVGTWVLSGTNTYTGTTLVSGGVLQFNSQVSLYNNESAATWTKNNINVGNGGTMAFRIGGGGEFTKANVISLLGLSDAATNGFMSGSSVGLDTTSGNFLYDSVIANTNGGSNILGLTKLGINTLTLDQDNTYTGRTVISAGTLQLGNGTTTGKLSPSSVILNNGTLTINRSDAVVQGTDFSTAPITGTGAFVQSGAGTTTLNAPNTFSGTTTVNAGTLVLANALALQNSALAISGTGSVTITGLTTPTFGGLSGSTNLNDLTGYGSVTNLTLNTPSGVTFTYSGIIGDGAGSMTLTKNGAGTQVLTGANLYTGTTFLNAGTLQIGDGTNAGSLSSSSAISLSGGTLSIKGNTTGTTNQTLGNVTVNSGGGQILGDKNGGTALDITLGSITATATGGSMVVGAGGTLANLPTSITTTTDKDATGIYGGRITFFDGTAGTGYNWATTVSGSSPYALSAYAGYSAMAASGTDTLNALVTGSAAPLSGNLTTNSLKFAATANTQTLNLGANTLTLTSGGLLITGAARDTTVISNGIITAGNGSGSYDLVVHQYNSVNNLTNSGGTAFARNTTISAAITDNGLDPVTLVKAGNNTVLNLTGTNNYSGGTVINGGTLIIGTLIAAMDTQVGSGPVTINNGGNLILANGGTATFTRAVTLNGGNLWSAGSGTSTTVSSTITLAANSTITVNNNNNEVATYTGSSSGAGGLSKAGPGQLRLNGSNKYTGPTVVSAGGLTVKASLYDNDTSKWTPANITVASGTTFMLNVGGAGVGELTAAQASTMFTNLVTNTNNNGLLAGSTIGVDTRTAGANTTTVLSGIIADATGPGGGAVNFRHSGISTTTLELAGANTYSGATIVDNNSTLKVSSLNSVFTNAALGTVHSASSSLGAPTTVANGTIYLGVSGSPSSFGNTFNGGSLNYTGMGEITDRVISFGGGGSGENGVIDQSGSGLLKFISNISLGADTRGTKNFILQGSTTGTGEIAGVIPMTTTGTLTLTKNGAGTWALSGANLYLGTTTINGGTLRFAKRVSLYNNTVVSWTKTNIIVNSTGTLALNVGGTGEFTAGNVTTLLANLGTSINNNGLRSGSAIGFDTTNAAGGSFTVADIIANSTGTGAGAIGLTKLGSNTLVLSNANTYTGATTVTAGTLQVNGSLASGSAIAVNGGTLGGTGPIGGTVNVAAAGSVAPGASAGTLSIGGGFNISAPADGGTGKLKFELGPIASSDKIAVTGTLTIGTDVLGFGDFDFTDDFAGLTNGTYTLITSGGITGTLDPIPANLTGAVGTGTGTLQINGNDLELVVSGISAGSAFDAWATLRGLDGTPGKNPAKNADPDNDGRNNLAEFAFDGNPLSGANDGKIVGKVATLSGNQVLTLTLPVRAVASFSTDSGDQLSALIDGIYYRIEGDMNLSTFADTITEVTSGEEAAIQAGLPPLSVTGPGGWTYRTFRHSGTVPATPKAFLRAKASETP